MTVDTPHGLRLRKAGPLEQLFNARGQLGFTSWVVSVAHYKNDSSAVLTKPLLYSALRTVIHANIGLAAQLPRPPAKPVWVRMPSLNLDEVITLLDKDGASSLTEVLEAEFATPVQYTADLPYWRLFVFRDGFVAFAYDHTLGDGQSGSAFHANLLSALRAASAGSDSPAQSPLISDFPLEAHLPPAVETAAKTTPPPLWAAKKVAQTLLPKLNPRALASWTAHPAQDPPTLVTRVRIQHISPADTGTLVALSRAHGTTLTGRCTRSRSSRSPLSSPRTTPRAHPPPYAFTIRTHCPLLPVPAPTDPDVSGYAHALDVHPATFPWAAAAAMSARLRAKAPGAGRHIGLLKLLLWDLRALFGDADADALGSVGKKRSEAFELSNLGAFPALPTAPTNGLGKEEVQWRIREVLFVQADVTLGAAVKLNVAGTPDGGLGLSVTWGEGAIEDEFGEAFARMVFDGVQSLCLEQPL
ncbi:uncharacterized protein BXZ73DRAFT_92957 [Epithele typhae]|uniref:uncharacterized protein n=1 Tax=Epithele typhae TaxID=378194 RepID=UPI002008CFF2|nr:uncharacterized protein BXZ73DRAFT_92957 [Epithele typhae]KAH9913464.1 hypothetical protein BXZ73DRAFT_92957 [Epithele typhae]